MIALLVWCFFRCWHNFFFSFPVFIPIRDLHEVQVFMNRHRGERIRWIFLSSKPRHPFSSASEFWKLLRCVILRPTWWCSSVKLCEMNLCVARLVFNEFIISISPLIDAVWTPSISLVMLGLYTLDLCPRWDYLLQGLWLSPGLWKSINGMQWAFEGITRTERLDWLCKEGGWHFRNQLQDCLGFCSLDNTPLSRNSFIPVQMSA